MADAFSTPAEHALEHEVQVKPQSMGDATDEMSVEDAFEVDACVAEILQKGYKTIGLQFPDELLGHSVTVYRAIQVKIAASGAQAYVLADSTYGSCCPDILSCSHLPADFLIHYGHACLTPTDAIPVRYVFPRQQLDVSAAAASLYAAAFADAEPTERKRAALVVWDVAYDWLSDEIAAAFQKQAPAGVQVVLATINHDQASSSSSSQVSDDTPYVGASLRNSAMPAGVSISDCVLFYLGDESRSLLNLIMTHANNEIWSYSASNPSATPHHPRSSRLLSKRLFAVHQARAADVFGLVVGNVGLAASQPLLARLRADLKKHHKKSYTLSVGRLNPAKLANFMEVECFVLVGCAEGGVVDSKDFLRPIITPWELELALQGEEGIWDPSKWTLNLASVLNDSVQQEGEKPKEPTGESDDADGGPEFDLVTGKYRYRRKFELEPTKPAGLEAATGALSLRNNEFTLARLESAGSNYLASRSWSGLEARVGLDEPAPLEQGRAGIARGYTEEKSDDKAVH